MAKKNQDWDKAKALFGMGKTLRDIEYETGIPFKTIDRRAKKEEWSKDSVTQKISLVTAAKEVMTQASDTERRIIDTESNKILEASGLVVDVTMFAIKVTGKAFKKMHDSEDYDLAKINQGMQALKTSRQAAGIDPIHPPRESTKPKEETPPRKVIFEVIDANHKKPTNPPAA